MAMDVPRGKEVARKRLIKRHRERSLSRYRNRWRHIALARLKPAAPSLDMSGQWPAP